MPSCNFFGLMPSRSKVKQDTNSSNNSNPRRVSVPEAKTRGGVKIKPFIETIRKINRSVLQKKISIDLELFSPQRIACKHGKDLQDCAQACPKGFWGLNLFSSCC